LNSRGTAGYRAPELLNEEKATFNNKVDIWAIGCILYELVFRKRAFQNDWAVMNYALTKTSLQLPSEFLDERNSSGISRILVILNAMLHLDPILRPSAELLRRVFTAACIWTIEEDLKCLDTIPTLEELTGFLDGSRELKGISEFRQLS
jgi:serine/threonine protein kinase